MGNGSRTHRVVVVGGGYAGVMAANRVSGIADAEVTLVEAHDRFTERIRLHQVAAGTLDDATIPFETLLAPVVRRIEARVDGVDAARRTLTLDGASDPEPLPWDWLVIATGSTAGPRPPGTYTVATLEEATRLRHAITDLRRSPTDSTPVRIGVVGGGLTAIETAAELCGSGGLAVSLHAATLGPGLSERARGRVRSGLRGLGVRVVEGARVPVTGAMAAERGGRGHAGPARSAGIAGELDADLVVWMTGFEGAPLARPEGLPVDAAGRLVVDPTLRVRGHDRIVAAGDALVVDDTAYAYVRMSCAIGMPLGAHAADTVARSIRGHAPEPFASGYLLQCISLGRNGGVVQTVTPDDRPRRLVVSGRLGAWTKERVCRSTIRWLRQEADRPGSTTWTRGPGA